MLTRFVCLANSYKEGGLCLAGIELDKNNNPKIENGRPKWIRPICKTPHGEIPRHLVAHVKTTDIVEIDLTGAPEEKNYQSENVFFDENAIKVEGKLKSKLDAFCENPDLVFGTKGKAVSRENIAKLNYSLMLIRTKIFEVIEQDYEYTPHKTQIRLEFVFNKTEYNLPVTDPVFLHRYHFNPDFLNKYNELFLSLSLGVSWNDWYYKLVAGVILPDNPANIKFDEDFDDSPY